MQQNPRWTQTYVIQRQPLNASHAGLNVHRGAKNARHLVILLLIRADTDVHAEDMDLRAPCQLVLMPLFGRSRNKRCICTVKSKRGGNSGQHGRKNSPKSVERGMKLTLKMHFYGS